MAYYFIMRMNLDLTDLAPARAQLCLHNLEDIQHAIRNARAVSKQRMLERKDQSGSIS
jgi:hypothetical protein